MSHSNVNEGRVAKEKKEPAPGPGAQRSPVDFHHQGSTQDFFNDVAPGVDNPLSLSLVQRRPHAAATIPQPSTRPWTTDTTGII